MAKKIEQTDAYKGSYHTTLQPYKPQSKSQAVDTAQIPAAPPC